jgi:hypothetical protein
LFRELEVIEERVIYVHGKKKREGRRRRRRRERRGALCTYVRLVMRKTNMIK